jgi:hypothetical protein
MEVSEPVRHSVLIAFSTRLGVQFEFFPAIEGQINFLTDLELKLRRRNVCDERLTKASITRALVDLLPLMDLDLDNVKDEESLKELFIACWKSGPNRSKTA